jgi:WD40 repeat protein
MAFPLKAVPWPVLQTLTGAEAVGAIAWSPSGKLWAFSTLAGEIRVQNGEQTFEKPGHPFGTFSLIWWDNDLLISGGADGKLRWWKISSGEVQETSLDSKSLWVEKLGLSPDRNFLAVGAGPTLTLWNRSRELTRTYPKRKSTVADLQWHPRGKFLASVANAEVCFWRVGSEAPVKSFTYASSLLTGRWSPRGDWFVVGCQDSTLHLWIAATGEDLYMSGFERKIRELDFHPGGRWLAVGGSPEITVWDFSGEGPAGRTPDRLVGHEDFVSQLAYSPDGKALASGGEDGLVLLWEVAGRTASLAAHAFSAPVTHLSWRPDSQALLAGSENGEATVLSLKP